MTAVLAFLLAGSTFLSAGLNRYGVAERRNVTFEKPVRVGDTLLPPGRYQVSHLMSGDSHMMLFQQSGVEMPAQAEVKCSLIHLHKKAVATRAIFTLNESRERVLQILVFKGDRAQHEF
ncbi:MAG TPA: hypothetical protein VLW84_13920 [Terriglobales bacterium]|nr:hypothetical protein [Terriglobales bacterium]